jgi:hypothetical protein
VDLPPRQVIPGRDAGGGTTFYVLPVRPPATRVKRPRRHGFAVRARLPPATEPLP